MSLLRVTTRPPVLASVAARRNAAGARQLTRLFSSTRSRSNVVEKPTNSTGSSRISTVFTGLLVIGVATTAFGLYEFYNSFTRWPQEIRADLRAGIKAKTQEDLVLSEPYLRRAYKNAIQLPLSAFGPEPYLKLSGIAIVLAEVMEMNNKPREAYETLLEALQTIRDASVEARKSKNASLASAMTSPDSAPIQAPTLRERMRGVALASKLGMMAETYQLPQSEEEHFLVYAVQEMLRVVREVQPIPGSGLLSGLFGTPSDAKDTSKKDEEDSTIVLADLQLPKWVNPTDVGAPIEALGAFYAKTGKLDYAMPLYLQATSLLIPPPPRVSSAEDRCRGAQLMSNLSELIMRTSASASSSEKAAHLRQQAESWAKKAHDIIKHTSPGTSGSEAASLCDVALAATLFNLGALRELDDDIPAAQALFSESLDQARRVNLREGVLEAKVALRRIERVAKMHSSVTTDTTKRLEIDH